MPRAPGPPPCSLDHRNCPSAAQGDLELSCTQGSSPEALRVATTVISTLSQEHLQPNLLTVNAPAKRGSNSWGASYINSVMQFPYQSYFTDEKTEKGQETCQKTQSQPMVQSGFESEFSLSATLLSSLLNLQIAKSSSMWGMQSCEELGAYTLFQEIFIKTGILRGQAQF